MVDTIAIIGANLAGGRAAEALRQAGYEGSLVLIGEEQWPPYERPPLSKEFLFDPAGSPSGLFLHDQAWYDDNTIELRLGTRAQALDLASGGVRLASGDTIRADRILLATGARARRLPLAGAEADNVHYLRGIYDAERMAAALQPGSRIVVIGMGVIGAEIAASARKLGCVVTAIEPATAPMQRMLGQRFGKWLGSVHRDEGVSLLLGVTPEALSVEDGLVRAVHCSDGSRIACDAVVVGIGVEPAVELARDAGLAIGNGVIVDHSCQTSNAHVFAAGDVADQPGFFGGRVRLETYQNASDQAAAAAQAMLGGDVAYASSGWAWSDQFDCGLQVAGRLDDRLQVIMRGSEEQRNFTAFFLDEGVVAGVLAVNRPRDMAVGRRLIERRISVDPASLADEEAPLNAMLKPKRS